MMFENEESNTDTPEQAGGEQVSSSAAPAAGAPSGDTAVAAPAAGTATGSSDDLSDLSAQGGASPASDPLDWNGELDSLTSADWFINGVEEKFRNVLTDGMRKKYRHIEAGFTKTAQEFAAKRDAWETKEKTLEAQLAKYQRFLDTGEDLGTQALREADALRRQLETAATEREAAERALREQLASEWQGRLTPLEQERNDLRQQLEAAQAEREQFAHAQYEEALDGLTTWISETAPALLEDGNEEDLGLLLHYLETGATTDPRKALRLLGVDKPQYLPGAPKEIPPALDVANTDSTASFAAPEVVERRKSYSEMKRDLEDRLRKELRR